MSFDASRRLASGVPGLDAVLGGGMLVGGIYLLAGGPGTGKTVIANQMCFSHARRGSSCVYITILAESHSRMVTNLETFEFFDGTLAGDRISYMSGARVLRENGLDGLYELIEEEMRRRGAVMLVLDGLSMGARMSGESESDLTQFLNRLGALLEYCNGTAVLCIMCRIGLTAPPYALADGLIELTYRRDGRRAARELFVRKLRGSVALEGSHLFEISPGHGVEVYPRIETATLKDARPQPASRGRCRFGVEGLDEMTGGGLPGGSSTALVGAPGGGKTLLGLHFLAEGARAGEPALYYGCLESPERLLDAGEGIGLPLRSLVEDHRLELVWKAPYDNLADAEAADLLRRVRSGGVRRLFVDGIDVLVRNALFSETLFELMAATLHELGILGTTTLIAFESEPQGTDAVRVGGWSPLVDNTIVLHYVEDGARLRRVVSIPKVRGSVTTPALHEFSVTESGLRVTGMYGGDRKRAHHRTASRDALR